jgi:hypothetical protein
MCSEDSITLIQGQYPENNETVNLETVDKQLEMCWKYYMDTNHKLYLVEMKEGSSTVYHPIKGLLWRKSCHGSKNKKAENTVLLACNADGPDKLKETNKIPRI